MKYSGKKNSGVENEVSSRKSSRDKKRSESTSDTTTHLKINSKTRNASTSDTPNTLLESSNKLNAMAANNSVSRQGSKKSGGSRSRLSSSNDEPTPDMFQESSNPEAGKKIVILSERRQIRNEITSNVKARKAEQAEIQAIKEKTNKTENVERYMFKLNLLLLFETIKSLKNNSIIGCLVS